MSERPTTPIAVVGMACRLPGGIDSPERLWEALAGGLDLVTEVPAERWDAEEFYDAEPGVGGRSISKWGAFLDDVAGFDAEFFGIAEREAVAIDPQQRLLLEVAWEAVEHAGIDPATLAGTPTGVFVGMTHNDYQLLAAQTDAVTGPYGFTGSNFGLASGRIAYHLGTRGPAYTVDSACSSALLGVHLACQSLHAGESRMALAGGVNILLEPRKMSAGSAQGMLSATGRCRAFDAAADGFVPGEAAAMLLFKRLPDALADGDRVLAVIRGTAANQDGRTVNIATPSTTAQEEVYRSALDAAGVDPATVGFVEAHGTGTPVGDPTEYTSLAQVYGSRGRPCALGSAKTNFGHSQSASGAVGLMKAILALRHGQVPPNLHFSHLPEQLAQIETGLFVPQALTAWPAGGDDPRRAAVSSYGLSGTNVHVVVEQAAQDDGAVRAPTSPRPAAYLPPLLIPLSATAPDSLRSTAQRLAEWAADRAGRQQLDLHDLAYTQSRRRAHRPVRTAVLAGDTEELVGELRKVADGDTVVDQTVAGARAGSVWVFSGQGSQWPAMGAALLATEPEFAAAITELEPLIAAESGFSVTAALSAPAVVAGIDRIQPTVFATQIALARALSSHGMRPGAVIGHSMGEVAAAVVAGALTLRDGVKVICRRSQLMQTLVHTASRDAPAGAMAAVELPAHQVLSELTGRGVSDVALAVIASPHAAVVGGAQSAIADLVAHWEDRGVAAREIAVDIASHTPQVEPILDPLIDALGDLAPAEPAIPYYSATLFDPRDVADFDAYYWSDNLRHAVRFSAAVQAALEDGFRVFTELAPQPLLRCAVEQNAHNLDIPVAVLATMRREVDMPRGLLDVVADLYSAGADIDFAGRYPDGNLVEAPLPAWAHRQLMLERAVPARGAGTAMVAAHPLLGAGVRLPDTPARHVWQAEVGTTAHPWLGEHRVHRVAVLPAAAYCEMAVAAAEAVFAGPGEIRDLTFDEMVLLDESTGLAVTAALTGADAAEFEVHSYLDGERIRRAAARLVPVTDGVPIESFDIDQLRTAHPVTTDGVALRSWFGERGIQYGPAFAGLTAARSCESLPSVLAEVGLPATVRAEQHAFAVHPALLDACFQALGAHPALRSDRSGAVWLPLGVRTLRVTGTTRKARYCYARVTGRTDAGLEADLDVLDASGAVVVSISGLRVGTGAVSDSRRELLDDRLLAVQWHRRDIPAPAQLNAGRWLLVSASPADPAGPGGRAQALAAAMRLHGADVETTHRTAGADDAQLVLELRDRLAYQGLSGVVVIAAGAQTGSAAAPTAASVSRVVRVARELADAAGHPPRLFVLTSRAQVVRPGDTGDLDQAGLRGLMRVISVEQPLLRATQIDVDAGTAIDHVAAQLLSDSDEDETAWRDGNWYVARLARQPLRAADRHTVTVRHEHDGARVQVRNPGDMQSLELVACDRQPPGPGQIEVAVAASSLNFADVLVAYGRYPSFEGRLPQLGADFAGTVTRVGLGVTAHRVGDRVAGITASGAWATFVTCDENLAVAVPPTVPEGVAAAVPSAHATAWYSMHDLARIAAGDKVLIHSATGGVGQAAIAIARAAGAEIFATAGSPGRRDQLRGMGIGHVYDSRSVDFADRIRADTDGYGVDIVLNSLPGAAQRAGLELLSFGGRFVELGKRDIYGDTRLGLFAFRRNLSFFAVDLALLALTNPGTVQRVLHRVIGEISAGRLPIPQTTHFELADAATAVRSMASARHTGKLVLDVPRDGNSTAAVQPEEAAIFRPDGAYIVTGGTGGTGGLGLFVAERLAELGCGRIILNGRSAPGPATQPAVDRIRHRGTEIEVILGDIGSPGVAEQLVAAAASTGMAVRGVLHAAGVVVDATLPNISDEVIARCWMPKAVGAWNLHVATAEQPLDWFCAFSSAAALAGSPGQGAYAAANSWLDGFARWRRAQGLPATSIAWGAWAGIGRGQALAQDEALAIAPEDGAYALEMLLRHDRAHAGYTPVARSSWLAALALRTSFAEAFRREGEDAGAGSGFLTELKSLPVEEWAARLRRLISDQIGPILRRTVDPDRPLAQYGLDSLGVLEVRTRIEAETGVRIGTTDITTVRALAHQLAQTLAGDEQPVQVW